MTVAEELREWAEKSLHTKWVASPMPFHLADAMREYRDYWGGELLTHLPPDDRRTFALIVAESLETSE